MNSSDLFFCNEQEQSRRNCVFLQSGAYFKVSVSHEIFECPVDQARLFIRSLFTKKNYIFDTFYILNVSSHSILLLKWFANLCFVSMPLYHLQSLAIPKSNWWTFAEIASQKSVPRPFLFFHLAKICQQNCCNRYDLFPSLAKMIALPRRDNLQVLQVCQMASITSFEPLSPVVALKFWRSQKKTFSISSSSFYILLSLNLLYLFTF